MVWYHNAIFGNDGMVWYHNPIFGNDGMVWYRPQSVPLSLLSPTTRMLCLLLVTPLSLFRNSSDSNIPLIPYSTFGNYGMVWYHTPIFGHYGMVWYGISSSQLYSIISPQSDHLNAVSSPRHTLVSLSQLE